MLIDVNLKLKHGTVTALVGRSGAGKSTIAALLSRFYEPASGERTQGVMLWCLECRSWHAPP